MLASAARSVLTDAARWSRDGRVPLSLSLGAALGMAVPVAVGAATGQIGAGMLAALGGLAVSSAGGDDTPRAQLFLLCSALLAGTTAVLVGSAIGGHGWAAGAALVLVVSLAALLGNFGRTAARFSAIFMAFVILGTALGAENASSPIGTTLIFAVGAAWTVAVTLLAAVLLRGFGRRRAVPASAPGPRPAPPGLRRRYRRWIGSLRRLAGWQYALRVGLCLLVAELVAVPWDQPWSYWIPLVVVLVLQRSVEATLARAWQRAIGTVAGVLVGSLFLSAFMPIWLLVLAVGLLSAVRPVLRVRNYTLYSVAMTPLIVILLDFGAGPSSGVLFYRLIDTGIGFLIAVTVGALLWPSLRARPE
jgi:MFS family permease